MNGLSLKTVDGRTHFAPGERIALVAEWRFDRAPEALEARLLWRTAGKGSTDVGVADTLRFDMPGAAGRWAFEITAPEAPYSFSGRLISLLWEAEAAVLPGENHVQSLGLVIAPGGKEVLLYPAAAPD